MNIGGRPSFMLHHTPMPPTVKNSLFLTRSRPSARNQSLQRQTVNSHSFTAMFNMSSVTLTIDDNSPIISYRLAGHSGDDELANLYLYVVTHNLRFQGSKLPFSYLTGTLTAASLSQTQRGFFSLFCRWPCSRAPERQTYLSTKC